MTADAQDPVLKVGPIRRVPELAYSVGGGADRVRTVAVFPFKIQRRRVGLERAEDVGLGAQVEVPDARNARAPQRTARFLKAKAVW
jgi:hypothetical protein